MPGLRKEVDLYDSKASLVYLVISRPPGLQSKILSQNGKKEREERKGQNRTRPLQIGPEQSKAEQKPKEIAQL